MERRLGGLSGIAFAAAYFAALFGVLDLPDGADSDAEVLELVTGDGRSRAILGIVLLAAAGVFFLWFAAALRDALGVADSTLGLLASSAATVFAAMLFVAGACFGVVPLATALDELPDGTTPEVARVLTQLGFVALLLFGLVAAGTMVLAVSVAAIRSRALPRWLAWASLVVGPLLFLGAFWVPQLLLLVWAAFVGIWLARAPDAPVPGR